MDKIIKRVRNNIDIQASSRMSMLTYQLFTWMKSKNKLYNLDPN